MKRSEVGGQRGGVVVRVEADVVCFAGGERPHLQVTVPRVVWADVWARRRREPGRWEWVDQQAGAKLVLVTVSGKEARLTLEPHSQLAESGQASCECQGLTWPSSVSASPVAVR